MMSISTMASSFLLTSPISSSASVDFTNTTGRGREPESRSCETTRENFRVMRSNKDHLLHLSITSLMSSFHLSIVSVRLVFQNFLLISEFLNIDTFGKTFWHKRFFLNARLL